MHDLDGIVAALLPAINRIVLVLYRRIMLEGLAQLFSKRW